jgi:hypothetical protein
MDLVTLDFDDAVLDILSMTRETAASLPAKLQAQLDEVNACMS